MINRHYTYALLDFNPETGTPVMWAKRVGNTRKWVVTARNNHWERVATVAESVVEASDPICLSAGYVIPRKHYCPMASLAG